MSEQAIIRFQNVSKRFAYTVEKPKTILEAVISIFSRARRREQAQDLWAIRNVSFDVMPGQCLGIIGRNGSGKSSMLKLVARILRPTSGRVLVNGRVSALLELGAGFHPDLTGRENIFLNASVLGLSKQDTHRCFDSIVAFSELEEFIDMPVKHYSSGMYMRLGFSVAIHVSPDILIVDEILSVGDQAFQTKCIDRIYEMKRKGTTIILVSHNLDMMRKLCTHLLWMEHGKVQASGLTADVAEQYKAYSQRREDQQFSRQLADFERWGTGDIEITAVRFLDEIGQEQSTFKTGDKMCIEIHYMAHKAIRNPEFGLAIFRQDGIHVNGPNSRLAGLDVGVIDGAGILRYEIEQLPLLPARYMVTVAVHDGRLSLAYDYHRQAYLFQVIVGGTTEVDGLIAMSARWHWEPLLVQETTESPPTTQPPIFTNQEIVS